MTVHDQPRDDPDRATAIRRALSRETLPGIESDLLTADVVTGIDVHGDDVTVVVDPDAAPETDSEDLMTTVMARIRELSAVEDVDVEKIQSKPDITGTVEDFDRVIAVASAKGGVGKSTVAAHLAAALAADGEVALFDADVHGPNIPRLLEIEGPVYSTDEGRPLPIEHGSIEVMSVGLLESDVPLAWRGAMAHDAVSDLFAETAWHSGDTLVIDLPPGTGDVVLTTLQEVPVDGLVVVTTPFHTSVVDTNRTIDLFRDEGIPILGAVVNMAGFTCDHCGEENELFDDGRADLATPVLSELPFDRELQERVLPGEPAEEMKGLATEVIEEVEKLGSFTPPADALDIRGLAPKARRERVREAFTGLDSGESFKLVSDRDPSPVREYLATLTDVEPGEIGPFEVESSTPETWLLTTEHP
jgi:ATP-binding protein involved in chromosome partitioning